MGRLCKGCEQPKPDADFRPQRGSCKACEAAYSKRRKEQPSVKEKDRKNKARMYAHNGDEIRARNRQWRAANRDTVRTINARLYELQADERKASAAKWDRENRDRRRSINANKRARKIAAFVEDVDRTVVYTRDEGICGICQEPVSADDFHLDHIMPLARGGEHSYANIQTSHPTCNIRKSDSYCAS